MFRESDLNNPEFQKIIAGVAKIERFRAQLWNDGVGCILRNWIIVYDCNHEPKVIVPKDELERAVLDLGREIGGWVPVEATNKLNAI